MTLAASAPWYQPFCHLDCHTKTEPSRTAQPTFARLVQQYENWVVVLFEKDFYSRIRPALLVKLDIVYLNHPTIDSITPPLVSLETGQSKRGDNYWTVIHQALPQATKFALPQIELVIFYLFSSIIRPSVQFEISC